jgi:hypothetical protein
MANYFVVLPMGPRESSDAEIGRQATNTGKPLEPGITAAKFVKVEAASVADAQAVARICYGGAKTTPVVVTEAQWKES